MKCHWCQQELEELEGLNQLECPAVHCNLTANNDGQIIRYTFYTDYKDRRYKIVGSRDTNTTAFYIKVGSGSWNYTNAFTLKRYLVFQPNKQDVLEGNAIFNKLKTLQLFS